MFKKRKHVSTETAEQIIAGEAVSDPDLAPCSEFLRTAGTETIDLNGLTSGAADCAEIAARLHEMAERFERMHEQGSDIVTNDVAGNTVTSHCPPLPASMAGDEVGIESMPCRAELQG